MTTGKSTFIVSVLMLLSACVTSNKQIVDIPTRPDVTQRMLVIAPPEPKAIFILFAGGHGGLQISKNGLFHWGKGNFLIRSRQMFVNEGVQVVVVDAPSDRQSPPYLAGFRQTKSHTDDIKAVISSLRDSSNLPIWLVGTSRGTQSVAFIATELNGPEGPDGIVLTSSILAGQGRPVQEMPLEKIQIPVLVVHHEEDGCIACPYSKIDSLMSKLTNSSRKELVSYRGGQSKGDPCEASAYHGFNGIENKVVKKIVDWVISE